MSCNAWIKSEPLDLCDRIMTRNDCTKIDCPLIIFSRLPSSFCTHGVFFCDLTTLFDVLHIAHNTNARHLKCKCTQSNNSDMSINIESFQALWSMIAISFLWAFKMNQLGRMKTLRRNKCTVRLTFKIQLRLLKCKTENARTERSFVNDE